MVVVERSEPNGAIARVWLDRPDVGNAFNAELVRRLCAAFDELGRDDGVRAIVLGARGKHFCAGADINWMRDAAAHTAADNRADALEMARMFQSIADCEKPTCARIHGDAFGGALGLIAACDTAIASALVRFAFSEVKLGLVPAVISAFALPKIGYSHARSLFTSGRRFDADEALRIGLVHQVVPFDTLDDWVDAWAREALSAGPRAVAEAKRLTRPLAPAEFERRLVELAETIARVRTSPEGQTGLAAFLEKRKPPWA